MTDGVLVAAFGQVHELAQIDRDFNSFVAELSKINKLSLINGARDFPDFIEKRQEIYSKNKPKYLNYFGKKQPLKDVYTRSQKLETTNYIKSELVKAAVNLSTSNIFNSDDIDIIDKNRHFITDILPDPCVAATYSIYEVCQLVPPFRAQRVLGSVSTLLFSNHYSKEHDLINPTGIFKDEMLEDYQYFPIFDLEVGHYFLQKIGIGDVLLGDNSDTTFFNFVTAPDFNHFIDMRSTFFSWMISNIEPRKLEVRDINAIRSFIGEYCPKISDPRRLNSTELAEILTRAIGTVGGSDVFVGESIVKKIERIKIAIFTATDLEDEIIRSVLIEKGFTYIGQEFRSDVSFNVFALYDKVHLFHVRSSAGASGVHGSSLVSREVLSVGDISLAISAGICFGTNPSKQQFGDVIIADAIYPYEHAAVRNGEFEFRGVPTPTEQSAVSYGRGYRQRLRGEYNIHVGGVLSGEKLIDEERFREIVQIFNPRGIGGEMEGWGIIASAQTSKTPFALIKGICDFASGKDDKYQEIAATNAISLAVSMVVDRWGPR